MRTSQKHIPQNPPAVRSLKIHPEFQCTTFSRTVIPHIRLKGKWLEKLGFKPEKRVRITTMRKKLIIELDD